ncbi:EscU/YscU/HrcU family type III secretion system export apparatus switch protein [Phytopseudomonas dryadis]|uniref:Flagellar biosynthetic protein FlhB n=1 Tax=Phytopseudomonas dryadis TaxID=2487520 RepID=A0A4Q9R160_9GAMM|nr:MULTISPECIES: EscU/YscU/HrcU family type III secretion system export apparatus switch protein [Pseudomonas]TBU91582.1 translocation protein in type III secretion system, RhcU [Pseudomonas dryadis]TBV07636.1 translocation protein in type III secretion system, RhcU [Pseudomonas dryadis]TBV19937.1 translocation protein in type III secretion system, RhcU [Pseudomonas sp. FRB 230]
MAGNSGSEEKSQPASDKKLREAREKGQVSKSQDMVSAVVLLGCTVCIAFLATVAEARVRALLELAATIYVEPFATVWPRLLDGAQQVLLRTALPILGVTVACVILTNIVTMRGVLFSGEPIKPDISRIDPIQGAKRIFSMRNLVEFLKGVFKVLVLSIAFYVVGRIALQALMESSRCGAGCIESVFFLLLKPLVATVVVTYLVIGVVDVLMQRWLFQREMRMTRSEQKRERKDVDGDPLIKRERQRQRREMQTLSSRRVGLAHATLMIGVEGGWLIGVRYVRGETPVPVVVCSAAAADSGALLAQSLALGLPRSADATLAAAIAKRAVIGEPIPANTFQSVADALVAARLI